MVVVLYDVISKLTNTPTVWKNLEVTKQRLTLMQVGSELGPWRLLRQLLVHFCVYTQLDALCHAIICDSVCYHFESFLTYCFSFDIRRIYSHIYCRCSPPRFLSSYNRSFVVVAVRLLWTSSKTTDCNYDCPRLILRYCRIRHCVSQEPILL